MLINRFTAAELKMANAQVYFGGIVDSYVQCFRIIPLSCWFFFGILCHSTYFIVFVVNERIHVKDYWRLKAFPTETRTIWIWNSFEMNVNESTSIISQFHQPFKFEYCYLATMSIRNLTLPQPSEDPMQLRQWSQFESTLLRIAAGWATHKLFQIECYASPHNCDDSIQFNVHFASQSQSKHVLQHCWF